MKYSSISVIVCLLLCVGCDEALESDAGRTDGRDGGVDAGDEPGIDCTVAAGDDLWTPPDELPAFTTTERGRVVRCGTIESFDAALVDSRARNPYDLDDGDSAYDGAPLTEGTDRTLLLYRTERRDGSGGYSSGTLYLPSSGAEDLPLIVHVSGTTGIADDCAPSRGRFTSLERVLHVLVGRGHAVFVPDLTGLGTPGTLGYLEAAEAAHATLDGARAALSIAPAGRLSGQIFISGHSAGGHAALSAQAIQREYAPELNVLGVSAIAGVWFDTAVFGELLTASAYSTTGADGWNVIFGALYFIGHTAAYDGEARAYEVLHPERRAELQEAFETHCFAPATPGGMNLREAVEGIAANVGEVFEPGLASGFANRVFCEAGIADRCPARIAEWLERFEADRPPLDPMGAPVWFHQGSLDTSSTVSSMQCPILEAGERGVDAATCYYVGVGHSAVAGAAAPWEADWVTALAAGGAAPPCIDATPFPAGTAAACGFPSDVDAGVADAGAVDAGVGMADGG